MIAIIVSEDQYLQQTLSKLLKRLGYPNVIATDSIDEADYFFIKEQKRIKLILFENSLINGIDAPLSRLIIQKEALNLAVLIHISNHSSASPFSTYNRDPLSRIDYNLSKPFGIRQLKTAIQSAQRRRARLRNKILMLGNQYENLAVEAMYTSSSNVHWKKIIFTENLDDFKKNYLDFQFRIGGVIIDPQLNTPEVTSYLQHFKKSTQGGLTPLAILSKNPKETLSFREFGDLYFNPASSGWDEILEIMSNRVVYQGEVIEGLKTAKQLIKVNEVKKAKKLVMSYLALDPKRWELSELLGKINELLGNDSKSIDHYRNSFDTNPCNPSAYLHLIKLLNNPEKIEMINQAKSFCPLHHQIKALEIHE